MEVMSLSWTNELYNVYEKNNGRTDCEPALLPFSHSTANAQIEITLIESGEIVSAKTIEKDDAVTIIPVTESSATRSSGISPHPLADKLIYLAKDYNSFVENGKDNTKFYEAYINQLREWYDSEHCNKAVRAIYDYLEKGKLIEDLINHNVLVTDETTGKLKSKVKIAGIFQEDSFVRFRINYSDLMRESRTWADKSLFDNFIAFNSEKGGNEQLCYATGEILPATYKHPAKIRNAGDFGRLISTNDESGFAYRGRFRNKEDAISVSYEFSQKMHNALKWLIARQGVNIENSLMLVVWESSMRELPDITQGYDDFDFDDDEPQYADTVPAYRNLLKKSLFGNENKFDKNSKAMIMGLDSATTGRLSISMYSELNCSSFLENLEKWHTETAWIRFNSKMKKNYVGSFPLKSIIECAFGTEQGSYIKCNPKLVTEYICKLIPCVTENRRIPKDIVRGLVSKASSPLKYDHYYNWKKVLETACGMIRKEKLENKEECKMALDENCTRRSYLYGRLLAVADAAESSTYERDEKRTTNAQRYFETFSNRPYTTWDIIRKRLNPYLDGMKTGTRIYYEKLINKITNSFEHNDFNDNSKLEPEYLHAYSCQLVKIYNKNKKDIDDSTEEA